MSSKIANIAVLFSFTLSNLTISEMLVSNESFKLNKIILVVELVPTVYSIKLYNSSSVLKL